MDKILSIKSPKELADRLRQQRLARIWSREELANSEHRIARPLF